MKELETLLENYWIIKEGNKELYYQLKDSLTAIKPLIEEKLGYQLIVNPYLIKLEKLPGKPEPWMGIDAFDSKVEYGLLCLMLVFLEDKGAEEQFVLSEITEFLQGTYPGEEKLDWTLFHHRKALIKVISFIEEMGLIRKNDGDQQQFINQQDVEVLYESTGISRYFMRHFSGNILNYNSWQDIDEKEWLDLDKERGRVRRNRVYRRLIMSPVVYNEGQEDSDYLYIKNYRNMLQQDIEKYLDADFHLHKNGALLILRQNQHFKDTFPNTKTISDIVLLVNFEIVENIKGGELTIKEDDRILTSASAFEGLVDRVRRKYKEGWSKIYREMSPSKLYDEVTSYMEGFQMIKLEKETKEVIIMPIVGKMIGKYPDDFLKGLEIREDETDNEQMDNEPNGINKFLVL
ncbi:TIGR02678 family protein [Alkaliphilus serpentinus]|uniref:TIGR02678 family protein n=1 Tax=Alkaliphilus serpentinus TaxID=1482731 RepID=A0A833M9F6_9FIRM|nr:TIGR02678 family protein [Alkaliphilus serpentinus]KAB3529805.1 TIGR02678 family protein [Alkaliphilus serpentinus]